MRERERGGGGREGERNREGGKEGGREKEGEGECSDHTVDRETGKARVKQKPKGDQHREKLTGSSGTVASSGRLYSVARLSPPPLENRGHCSCSVQRCVRKKERIEEMTTAKTEKQWSNPQFLNSIIEATYPL